MTAEQGCVGLIGLAVILFAYLLVGVILRALVQAVTGMHHIGDGFVWISPAVLIGLVVATVKLGPRLRHHLRSTALGQGWDVNEVVDAEDVDRRLATFGRLEAVEAEIGRAVEERAGEALRGDEPPAFGKAFAYLWAARVEGTIAQCLREVAWAKARPGRSVMPADAHALALTLLTQAADCLSFAVACARDPDYGCTLTLPIELPPLPREQKVSSPLYLEGMVPAGRYLLYLLQEDLTKREAAVPGSRSIPARVRADVALIENELEMAETMARRLPDGKRPDLEAEREAEEYAWRALKTLTEAGQTLALYAPEREASPL